MFCLYFILSLCVVTYCQDAPANQEQNKHAASADTASEEVCAIEARCRKLGVSTTKWTTFATTDDTAKIEEEIDILKKKNAKLEKDEEESKGIIEDLIKRIVCLENESAGKKCKNGGTSEKETSTMASPMTSPMTSPKTDLCTAVKYENKCFIPVKGRFGTYDALVAKCKSLGGQVANIYSQTHINIIAKYVTERATRSNYWQRFNLGMKYDPKAKKLTLRDGSDATDGLLWQPGSPYTVEGGAKYATYTNVVLAMIIPDSNKNAQYIVNYPPYWIYDGLCEIE